MSDHLALDRDKCLSDVCYALSLALGLPPMASSAVLEHVFQAIIEHFYQHGSAYLPSIGWLHFLEGEVVYTPCDEMEQTSAKLRAAVDSRTFSFANIESVLEAARSANSIQNSETC